MDAMAAPLLLGSLKMAMRTLRTLIEGLAEHGELPAVIQLRRDDVSRWSFAQLAEKVERLARGLAGRGIGRGSQVALLAPNRPQWIVAALAIMRAGATAVPVDVQFADDLLVHVLRDSDARCVFTTAREAGRIERLKLTDRPDI